MTARTQQPTVEGPVTGGRHGWAFGRPLFDLADRGYVEEEHFLTGVATTYAQVAGTEWGRDGRWSVEADRTEPYRTRILVYRPADPARFNGTVVVCWNNVTAGYELFGGESPELLEAGYAFVAASVQKVGIHGFPEPNLGLAAWDPERYGSLSISSDDLSFDIFSQVGRAVGPDRDRRTDPLGGLDVRRTIAIGASQSAGRLGTYVNAIHPIEHVFDGYMLQIYFGTGTPIQVGDAVVNINAAASGDRPAARLRGTNQIRDDLDVPVMIVNSELEALACQAVRQPDTDRLVTWESAGTCHVSVQSMEVRRPKFRREFGFDQPVPEQMNRIGIQPQYDAATHHLNAWVQGGPPPPSQPLIELDANGDAVRDEHGIAVGGLRLPAADVPVATNSAVPAGEGIFALLYGSSHPFPVEKLDDLYGDEATFLARFEEAARRAEKAGVLLSRDVGPLVEEAALEHRRVREA